MRKLITALAVVALLVAGCQTKEERAAGHQQRAESYYEQEQWDEAKIELLNLIQVDPENAEARERLGEVRVKLGEYGDALWQYQEAVRLQPDRSEWRVRLATLEFASGRMDRASEHVSYVLEREPRNVEALMLRARVSARSGDSERVLEDLDAALEEEPDNANALMMRSQIYSQVQRWDESRADLERAAEINNDTTTWALLGVFLFQRDLPDEAEAAYARSLEVAATAEEKKNARLLLANFYLSSGDREAAEAELIKAREAAPDDSELAVQLARYYVVSGQREKAVAMLEERAKADPDNPEHLVTLARFHRGGDDRDRALTYLDLALDKDPNYEEARVMKGEIFIQMGIEQTGTPEGRQTLAQGSAIIDQVLELNPGSVGGLFARAKLLIVDSKFEEASVVLRRVLEEQPVAAAHFLLGTCYLAMRQDDLARAELLSALQLDATHHLSRTRLAALYLRSGQPALAAQEARRGLGLRPAAIRLSMVLVQALIQLREPAEAREVLDSLPLTSPETAVPVRVSAIRPYLELGAIDKAREIAAQLVAEDATSHRGLASIIQVEARAGEPLAALPYLDAAIAADPEDAELYKIRGSFYLGFRKPGTSTPMFPGEAQADLLTALDKDPDSDSSYLLLGKLRERMGALNEALKNYAKAAELNPQNTEAFLLSGALYESQGQPDKAAEQYRALVDNLTRAGVASKDLAVAMNNLAWLLADAPDARPEDLDRALELAQDAKELMPDDPNVADTLGWVMYRRDIHAAAIPLFREAISSYREGTPARAVTRYHLALSYEADGQRDRAIDELRQSLAESERFPGRPEAEAALKRLEASAS